jgi:hypothetical protein
MTAYDRTSPRAGLEPATAEALRDVLGRALEQGNHADELHDVLCRAASESHAKQIRAEQLLVILKDLWYSLPELARATNGDLETRLLQELISRCIQEYYAEGKTS